MQRPIDYFNCLLNDEKTATERQMIKPNESTEWMKGMMFIEDLSSIDTSDV